MSTNLCSHNRFSAYEREFAYEVFVSAVFSSFYCAVGYRRDVESLTHKDLADRLGADKTRVSKLLSGPSNWTLKTVAELAHSLDLEIEFTLIDKSDRRRCFMPHGPVRRSPHRVAPIVQSIGWSSEVFLNEPPAELVIGANKKHRHGRRIKPIDGMSIEGASEQLFQMMEL